MSSATDPVSTLAFCWRIERRDGAGLALTSHDCAIVHDRTRYAAEPGLVPAAVTRRLGLEPHTGEASGALTSEAITERDLQLGKWDEARVTLLAIDWEYPDSEAVQLLRGELGEVSVEGHSFSAELRGAAWRLTDPVCPTTSPECRARFGDKSCRVDLAGRTVRATVVSTHGAELQLDRVVDERFVFGRLRFRSGGNCGTATVVLAVNGALVRIRELPRESVSAGTIVEIREGCDKRLETCTGRFANAANFRGEPHLPGNDLLTRYPGS